ncbi:MAG: adenylyl-sulfate kinase [Anaerolineales bacterium]|nr:adenylyl-sulfate kinase [Anaerolineales bacterium]
MKRGLFVVLPGVDGSGKSTVIDRLSGKLESEQRKVLILRGSNPKMETGESFPH